MTGGTGASSGTGASRRGGNKAALTVHGAVHGGAWREPWRPMASRDPFTDRFFASQDPLCLSLRGREPVPGDWANPRALASLPSQGRTRGVFPFTGETLSLETGHTGPFEGETLLPEAGRTLGPCVSPLTGENKRGLPLHRRDPVPGGWTHGEGETLLPEAGRTLGPCVSPLTGENKRGLAAQGVCDSPIG